MDLRHAAALGVAGNMTGHLEQAGEAADFAEVRAAQGRPKGMFPIYLPGLDHRLGVWPFSSSRLRLPVEAEAGAVRVQPEPEVVLHVDLAWGEGGVVGLTPRAFAAGDDTSLRKAAPKIHHKKNWGPDAKGLAERWLPLDRFDATGALGRYRLACWLVRDGACRAYGEDSPVRDYGTCFGELVAWMVHQLRHQADEGPLDHLSGWLDRAGRPEQAVIFIGATRYTPWGAQTFVQPGDEVVVVVYDEQQLAPPDVAAAVARAGGEGTAALPGASVLRRRVEPAV